MTGEIIFTGGPHLTNNSVKLRMKNSWLLGKLSEPAMILMLNFFSST